MPKLDKSDTLESVRRVKNAMDVAIRGGRLAAGRNSSKKKGAASQEELAGNYEHEEVAGFELGADKIDSDLQGKTPEQEKAEIEQINKEFETSVSPVEYQAEKNLVFEESAEPAKGLYFSSIDTSEIDTVHRERGMSSDILMAQARSGREEALCFQFEVTGEAEYVHTVYAGQIPNEKKSNETSYLLPIVTPLEIVAEIAHGRIQEKVAEKNIDNILAEFSGSLAKRPTEEIINLIKPLKNEAISHMGTGFAFRSPEASELNKQYIKERYGLELATAA